MKFAELYHDNVCAVKETLKAMWCSDIRNERQQNYASQISDIIDNELFATESFIPLVQCMDRYESVHSVSKEEAIKLVDNRWKASYPPYEHQYQAWKALTNTDLPKKSMVVTTGTGSGKTECFMLPLVADLAKTQQKNEIQAIFLYPLNALMEDQKERLQELLTGTDLKFAVYNGNMPNDAGSENSSDEKNRALAERVKNEREKFPNIIPTRQEMHKTFPNILLTNPTMLEYMLLRQKDQPLFTEKSLRWIVIDETHTFSGAGAAELSMLLRRVLDAFNTEAKDIRFATSSATIGNAKTDKEKADNNEKLRKFISDITGVPMPQVELIDGIRKPASNGKVNPEVQRCRDLLGKEDYVMLTELIPQGKTIEEKLAILDELCGLEEEPLKAKVHFFYQVPNSGLKVQLDDSKDGIFKVKSKIDTDPHATPYLELLRCQHCGEYFTVGESTKGSAHKYHALTKNGDDMFSFDDQSDDISRMVFSLTDNQISADSKEGNTLVRIQKDEYFTDSNAFTNGWSIVTNVQKCCPHCGNRVIGRQDRDSDNEIDDTDIHSNTFAFRIPADYISRVIAPSILPHLHTKETDSNDNPNPHHGQQYISFVDSRQSAAKSTMKQNLEEERLWVYSRIFNELNKRRLNIPDKSAEIKKCNKKLALYGDDPDFQDEVKKIKLELQQLELGTPDTSLSWSEIFNLLFEQDECERLAYQFANKSQDSEEFDQSEDKVEDFTKSKYVHAIMIELLGRHPRLAMAPETLGLFTTSYPKLKKIDTLPDEVKAFSDKITLTEWKNLLKIFLDFNVRSNQSIFLKLGENSTLDIFACQRFGTTKPARRPVYKPAISDDIKVKGNYSSIVFLLASVLDNPNNLPLSDIAYTNRASINKVLDALWTTLTVTTKLLQLSEHYDGSKWVIDEIKDNDGQRMEPYRLNVIDISYDVFNKTWICDARRKGSAVETLRPVDSLFMHSSPYIVNGKVLKPKFEDSGYTPFPYIEGVDSDKKHINTTIVSEWAKENRKSLCDAGLWGDNGSFANRLNSIYTYPEIFVQAEHTAQVDKLVSRHSQELFKEQKINILACSTTMEMGVDLGNLELVLMTSLPPHPSNYKQRAGRSGRNDDTRSACITLCGSDAIGLRTLVDPMNQIIKRTMAVPFVDLKSPQVIQRHSNAYLFRASGIFFKKDHANKNNLDQEVIEFFTPFTFDQNEKSKTFVIRTKDANATEVYPDDLLGDEHATKYYTFIGYLNGDNLSPDYNSLDNNTIDKLNKILTGTCYENGAYGCAKRCKYDIEDIYASLLRTVSDIKEAYEKERDDTLTKDPSRIQGNAVNTGYGYVLRHKYSECLAKNIISYFATHRFTPNANMPCEVIEYNVNLRTESTNKFNFKKSNNPSYALQEAISQYTPGNTIVLENRTSIIRGLQYTGQYRLTSTFKQLYSDGNDTVIEFEHRLHGQQKKWPVSGTNNLSLIEPVSFIPDINEDNTRVMDGNIYTQVSAQLIGAGTWKGDETTNLIAMRSNQDCCEAKILYYNEGLGYGYCFCKSCGKAIIETNCHNKKFQYPDGMQDQVKSDNGKTHAFHYRIDRKNFKNNSKGYPIRCEGEIKRNVIIGGLIQTDYCEIKIKTEKTGNWIARSTDNDRLLITLGILFTKTFTEFIGKDRKDVGFAIMPNGHLCIFDTNPGGSGYSNQLSSQRVMMTVIENSMKLLDEATSKEALLDKFTLRYIDKLDVYAAKEWLNLVIASFVEIPDDIKALYPDAKTAVIEDIYHDFETFRDTTDEKILFVNNNWNKWLYQPESSSTQEFIAGLKQRLGEIRKLDATNIRLCIANPDQVPFPLYRMMIQIEEWAKVYSAKISLGKDLHPLALIGDSLYFTNDPSSANACGDWGHNSLFSIPVSQTPAFTQEKINVNIEPNFTKKFKLEMGKNVFINSKDLPGIIETYIPDIIKDFTAHCKKHKGETMTVKYQDEHLKSTAGMIATLQFIEFYMEKFGNPFTLEFINEEYSDYNYKKGIGYNIPNDWERNTELKRLYEDWKEDINNNGLDCKSIKNRTLEARSLPHWRFLSFGVGGRTLLLYPNGGIINEWFPDQRRCSRDILNNVNTSAQTNLPLKRNMDIMYDAEIKDE